MKTPLLVALTTLCTLTAVGCASQQKNVVDESMKSAKTTQAPKAAAAPKPQVASSDENARPPAMSPVYYALDSAQLLPQSQQELQGLAQWLRQHPSESVTVSGHTCDLGTSEYNLALGQKRAAAVRDYLTALGVSSAQVQTVSYGEEHPAVDGATNEDGRSKNRRSEFSLRMTDGHASR